MRTHNRLQMPVGPFGRWWRAGEVSQTATRPYDPPWLARLFVFGGAAALTPYGAYEMYQVLSVSRTTILPWLLLIPLSINLSPSSPAFSSGLLGLCAPLPPPAALAPPAAPL